LGPLVKRRLHHLNRWSPGIFPIPGKVGRLELYPYRLAYRDVLRSGGRPDYSSPVIPTSNVGRSPVNPGPTILTPGTAVDVKRVVWINDEAGDDEVSSIIKCLRFLSDKFKSQAPPSPQYNSRSATTISSQQQSQYRSQSQSSSVQGGSYSYQANTQPPSQPYGYPRNASGMTENEFRVMQLSLEKQQLDHAISELENVTIQSISSVSSCVFFSLHV
jgi:hypothetical protein